MLGTMIADHPATKQELRGCIKTIVLAMKRYPYDALIQRSACIALTKVYQNSTVGEQSVRHYGGIEQMLIARHNHPDNANIQKFTNILMKLMATDRLPHTSNNRNDHGEENSIIQSREISVISEENSIIQSGGISVISDISRWTNNRTLASF